jgi:DNA repair exonuclease SbcCD ATPase subunit
VDLDDVAHELYGLLPADFTAERNQRAKDLKADGDADFAAQVKALGKPTSAAWLVNQLVRHHGEEVEQVAAVGAALREAQQHLGSGELMALNKQRHLVLRAVVQQARALARSLGQPVSTAVADEVEQTLRAVMSDPDAAEAVRTGTLRRSLAGTGLGPVDLTDAVALTTTQPGRRPAPTAAPGRGGAGQRGSGRAAADAGAPTSGRGDELAERRRQREREQAERKREERAREQAAKALAEAQRFAEEADEQAASADDALGQAQGSLDELVATQQRLADELQALERQVRDCASRLDVVRQDAQAAERARDQARHEADVARRAAERARTRLERLT